MLNVNDVNQIYLGCQGENLARTIIIDVKPWLVAYPGGTVAIWHKRNGAEEATATGAVFDSEAGTITWRPTGTDTYVFGEGEAEIRLTVGNVIKKSRTIITDVAKAVTGANGEALDSGWQGYLDAIQRAAGVAIMKNGMIQFAVNSEGHLILSYTEDVPIPAEESDETDEEGDIVWIDKDLGKVTPSDEQVQEAANTYLATVITNPDSPPLDRSLSSNVSAAPADMVGDLESAITSTEADYISGFNTGYYSINPVRSSWKNGYFNASGQLVSNSNNASPTTGPFLVKAGHIVSVITDGLTANLFTYTKSGDTYSRATIETFTTDRTISYATDKYITIHFAGTSLDVNALKCNVLLETGVNIEINRIDGEIDGNKAESEKAIGKIGDALDTGKICISNDWEYGYFSASGIFTPATTTNVAFYTEVIELEAGEALYIQPNGLTANVGIYSRSEDTYSRISIEQFTVDRVLCYNEKKYITIYFSSSSAIDIENVPAYAEKPADSINRTEELKKYTINALDTSYYSLMAKYFGYFGSTGVFTYSVNNIAPTFTPIQIKAGQHIIVKPDAGLTANLYEYTLTGQTYSLKKVTTFQDQREFVFTDDNYITVHFSKSSAIDIKNVDCKLLIQAEIFAELDNKIDENTEQLSGAITAEEERAKAAEEEIEALFAEGIAEAVSTWMDEHPEASSTVEDGSLTEAKFSDQLKQKTINNYITPEMFGAVGDNETDDTEAIQAAVDYALETGRDLFLQNNYAITDTIVVGGGVNIYGNGHFLNATMSDPVMQITTANGEIRNQEYSHFGIRNYGTGNCLEISGSNSFSTCLISCCSFFASEGWCIDVHEIVAHSKIMLCTFSGNGINANCGDANIIEKNLFYGANKIGVYLNTYTFGVLNNAIINNTVVDTGYGILIDAGDQTWICNNQIEYGGSTASQQTPDALVYLRGNTRKIYHCVIENNNFGGGTYLSYCLAIGNAEETIVRKNRFVSVNTAEVYAGQDAMLNTVSDDNYVHSTSSNPRTDAYQRLKVSAYAPKGMVECWHKVDINDSASKILVRRSNSNVSFAPVTITKTNPEQSITTLFTLPEEYRPSEDIVIPVSGYKDNVSFSGNLQVNANGTVDLDTATTFTTLNIAIPDITIPKFSS